MLLELRRSLHKTILDYSGSGADFLGKASTGDHLSKVVAENLVDKPDLLWSFSIVVYESGLPRGDKSLHSTMDAFVVMVIQNVQLVDGILFDTVDLRSLEVIGAMGVEAFISASHASALKEVLTHPGLVVLGVKNEFLVVVFVNSTHFVSGCFEVCLKN